MMKYLWFILITLLAVSASSQVRVDSLIDSSTIDDTYIAGGIPALNNYGVSTRLSTAASNARAILIRPAAFAMLITPTTYKIDSMELILVIDSVDISNSRGDSAILMRRDWQEGALNGTTAALLIGCNWNKYGSTEFEEDFAWETAGALGTSADRYATGYDIDSTYTTDVAGDSTANFMLRDTAVLRAMRDNDANYAGGIAIRQVNSGTTHFGSTEHATAGRRPKFRIYSHLIPTGTNQRLSAGSLGMRLRAGTVGKRLKPDYGH